MEYLYRANDGTIFYIEDECIAYERKLKYDHCAISRCCKNKQKTSYGYVWRIIKNV